MIYYILIAYYLHGTSCVIMYIWEINLIKSNVYREPCFAVKINIISTKETYLTVLFLLVL